MVGRFAEALAFAAVLSMVSAAPVNVPIVIKKPPVLVVPPAPINTDATGPVPVIPPNDRVYINPIRLPTRTARAQFQPPSFGGSVSGSEAFNFGGNVNIPGVGGFDYNQSAAFGGGFGFGTPGSG